jgi:hypothetical protein
MKYVRKEDNEEGNKENAGIVWAKYYRTPRGVKNMFE